MAVLASVPCHLAQRQPWTPRGWHHFSHSPLPQTHAPRCTVNPSHRERDGRSSCQLPTDLEDSDQRGEVACLRSQSKLDFHLTSSLPVPLQQLKPPINLAGPLRGRGPGHILSTSCHWRACLLTKNSAYTESQACSLFPNLSPKVLLLVCVGPGHPLPKPKRHRGTCVL